MPLPKLPPKRPRTSALSVRLCEQSLLQLKSLAISHNLSQADVIECLLEAEFSRFQKEQTHKGKVSRKTTGYVTV